MQLLLSWTASASTKELVSQKVLISWDLQKSDLLENKTSNTRNDIKSQIKKQREGKY